VIHGAAIVWRNARQGREKGVCAEDDGAWVIEVGQKGGRSMIDLELLDFDLQEYVSWDDDLLDHPLVRCELRSQKDIAKANEQYESKTAGITEAVNERDWMLFVCLHVRPHRPDAVVRLIKEFGVSGKQLWPVVGYVWCDTEDVRGCFDLWRDIWSMDDTDQALVMSDQERDALALLPERFEIWRGVGHKDAVCGYSWTLNREKACWYAVRFVDAERSPLLATGWIRKADVLAHFLERHEAEIVVFPENVQDIKLFPLASGEIGPRASR
jgi:hypothetical protein